MAKEFRHPSPEQFARAQRTHVRVIGQPPEATGPEQLMAQLEAMESAPQHTQVAPTSLQPGDEVMVISVHDVIPNRFQPRLEFDDTFIENLADDIRDNSLQQYPVVRRLDPPVGGAHYELIAGENRWRAIKDILKRDEMPAVVRAASDVASARSALAENLHRKNLSDLEVGLALHRLREMQAVSTVSDMARLIGGARAEVRRLLAFAELPDTVLELLRQYPRAIGGTAAYEMVKYCQDGHTGLVAAAVEKVIQGKMTQTRMLGWIRKQISGATRSASHQAIVDAQGRPRAKIHVAEREIKIHLLSDVDMSTLAQEVEDVLRQHIAQSESAEQDE